MQKQEIEDILHTEISDELFGEALEYAKRKQKYIYEIECRDVVLQDWYLVLLIKEYVISILFSRFTMDLCEMLRNMEKEPQVKDHGTPQATIL